MITRISRGDDIAGAVRYLIGPGRRNEHSAPHLVAGSEDVQGLIGVGEELKARDALPIGEALDFVRRAHGTELSIWTRGEHGERVGERPAHVWHCSLSLAAEEGALPDERWGEIAHAFVAKMGFAGEDVEAPCSWAAFRHGLSVNGNDHVHVLVSLVHEDGRAADVWNERWRVLAAAGEIEREFGLAVLPSRAAGRAGERGVVAGEREVAARAGEDETTRRRLETVLRGCAEASRDEAEFVRRARRQGVRLRPRYARGRTDVVVGYSAGLPGRSGRVERWFGGGHVQRDLALPRLRAAWADSPERASAAVAEWNAAARGERPTRRDGREVSVPDPGEWTRATRGLEAARARLAAARPEDKAAFAHVARETAGAFAAWSMRVETSPGPLHAAAREIARVAQLRAADERPRADRAPERASAAYILASLASGGRAPVATVALVRQLLRTADALAEAMRARDDARAAERMVEGLRVQVREIRARHLEPAGAGTAGAPGQGRGPGAIPDDPGPRPPRPRDPGPER